MNAFPRYPSHLRNRPADWTSFADVAVTNGDGRFLESDSGSDDDSDELGGPNEYGAQHGTLAVMPASAGPTWFEQGAEGFQQKCNGSSSAPAAASTPTGEKGPQVMEKFEKEIKKKGESLGLEAIVLVGLDEDWEEGDEEEDPYTLLTIDEIRERVVVAFFPKQCVLEIEKRTNELAMVGMDSAEDIFPMRNTASSAVMFQIIAKSLSQVQGHLKKEKYEKAFAMLLGITIAAHMDDHWWHDTDDNQTPANLTKALAKTWQGVLARTNDELGGIPEETRMAVRKKLSSIRTGWETEGPQFGQNLKFKWNKVAPTRE